MASKRHNRIVIEGVEDGEVVMKASYTTENHRIALSGDIFPSDLILIASLIETVKTEHRHGTDKIRTMLAHPDEEL